MKELEFNPDLKTKIACSWADFSPIYPFLAKQPLDKHEAARILFTPENNGAYLKE